MKTLVAFAFLVVAVVADPQLLYGGGILPHYGVLPIARSNLAVTYPSQDTSRGIPQPIDDTWSVKHAKAVFAEQYRQTAVRDALLNTHPLVHTIHKRQAILPIGLKTPAATSPLVYSSLASPYTYGTYGYGYSHGLYPYSHFL